MKKVAYLGIFLTLALILSYVEAMIPFPLGIPGVKLGLCNLMVVLLLYLLGWKEALIVSVLRAVLVGFLFGNPFGILYSLAGSMVSFFCMFVLYRLNRFHVVTVSICGGIMHNMGQLAVAALLIDSYYVAYYVPVLLIAGGLTGCVIGVLAHEIGTRLQKMIRMSDQGSNHQRE
ncbi:MAG: Gx transporter family protein [Lachnospiraceae bacterium]|nr:Gx transporter family protein [Lachnospiraceae bacterium]